MTAPGSAVANNNSLTAEQVQKEIVAPLQDASVFLNARPKIYPTNGSPVRVPLLRGMTHAPTFVGENEEIPDDARLVTDELTLLPEGMKSLKIISRFSRELMRQSIIDVQTTIKDRLVTDIADTLDHVLLTSSVTDGSRPLGLLNYPGVQRMPGVGVPSLDDLHDAIGMMFNAKVDTSFVRWFMPSNVFVNLRKLKDGNDRYQVQPDPTQAGAYTLLGVPVSVTNRIPGPHTEVPSGQEAPDDTTIVLADWSKIACAQDQAPEVTILPERYAEFDQVGIRVTTRYDARPLIPEAVLLMQGVSA